MRHVLLCALLAVLLAVLLAGCGPGGEEVAEVVTETETVVEVDTRRVEELESEVAALTEDREETSTETVTEQGPTPRSDPTPTAACVAVPAVMTDALAAGLTVAGGGSLRDARAVASTLVPGSWFVAAEIDGEGIDGDDVVGVWWQGRDLTAPGPIAPAEGMAQEFGDWGVRDDVEFRDDPAVRAAEQCVTTARAAGVVATPVPDASTPEAEPIEEPYDHQCEDGSWKPGPENCPNGVTDEQRAANPGAVAEPLGETGDVVCTADGSHQVSVVDCPGFEESVGDTNGDGEVDMGDEAAGYGEGTSVTCPDGSWAYVPADCPS